MGNADKLKGKAKEAAGALTDDERRRKEGQAQQKAGKAKEKADEARREKEKQAKR